MATRVAVINMKGGVGKSTLTVNLAWHYAAYKNWGKKVLVVDLDPQFNASQYLVGVREYQKILDSGSATIWDVFEQGTRTSAGGRAKIEPENVIKKLKTFQSAGVIDLIPSRLDLAFSLKNPAQKEHFLSQLIDKVDKQYDLVLVDCAPTESVLTTAAYLTCNRVLVPVRPEYLSSIGLPLLASSMNDFRDTFAGHEVAIAGIVFNAVSDYSPEEVKSKSEVRAVAKQHGWKVFDAEVPYSRSFPKGAREGKPIFWTSYSRGFQVAKFNVFASEFAKSIGL